MDTRLGRREFLRRLAAGAGAAGAAPWLSPAAGQSLPDAEAAAPRIGAALIGKLEGPDVVTDPSRYPKAFAEAPTLQTLSRAGHLPPVKDRIGADPLVLKPVHEVGKYGGTLHLGFTGPADFVGGVRFASGPDSPLMYDFAGHKIVPNIARGYEISRDGRVITLHLRRGMRWSDGTPFTADDFLFWFEDMYSNKELVPESETLMQAGGKPVVMEKIDASTVRYRGEAPNFLFPQQLAGGTHVASPSWYGRAGLGGYAPSQYLKQFHPKYTAANDLEQKFRAAKFDSWVSYFKNRNSWHLNPDLPVISPWKTVLPPTGSVWALVRNPYSVWVDTAGNQLPYIDRIEMTLTQDLDVLILRAMSGGIDYQSRNILLDKLPLLIQNQAKGNYQIHLDPGEYGADMALFFNMSFDADPEIAKWFNTADFRRALSLGIDRHQANEAFWLGTGTPGSVVPAESNAYNPGPAYRNLWATHDPARANAMLDRIGLKQKDAQGFRLRTDGKGRLSIEVMTIAGQMLPFTGICEMIKEQYKQIGIDLVVREVERSLALTRTGANQQQLAAWANDGSDRLFVSPVHVFPYEESNTETTGPLYARWFNTNGAQGKEPPTRIRQMMDDWRKAFSVPQAEQVRLGKEIWRIAAEDVYVIGVVGLGPAANGVRIVKNNLGNAPSREYNCSPLFSPGISRPQTFYWKS